MWVVDVGGYMSVSVYGWLMLVGTFVYQSCGWLMWVGWWVHVCGCVGGYMFVSVCGYRLVGTCVSGWVGWWVYVSVGGWVGGYMSVSVFWWLMCVAWWVLVCVSMWVVDVGRLMGTCLSVCLWLMWVG